MAGKTREVVGWEVGMASPRRANVGSNGRALLDSGEVWFTFGGKGNRRSGVVLRVFHLEWVS